MAARAPSLAILAIAFPLVFASAADAQNLDAGKSPAQLFASNCTACHKGSKGLLKTVSPGSLASFLREHYTTSDGMASALSAYLIAGGDGRPAGTARQTASTDVDAQPNAAPDNRKQRQAEVTPDGQPDGTKGKPRTPAVPPAAATDGQPAPADQLPKGPKARAAALAKQAAAAKAAAAKAAADAAKAQPGKTPDKTDVAALPQTPPPAPKPAALTDIGTKPAEDPADMAAAKPKSTAGDEARQQVAKTEPAEAAKPQTAKSESAKPDAARVEAAPVAPKPQGDIKSGAASSASEQASLEASKPEPAPAALHAPAKPDAAAAVASAKASVSQAEKASAEKTSEVAVAPRPVANSMAPPPSPPISY